MLEMYIVSLAFPWVDALLPVFSSIWVLLELQQLQHWINLPLL
jgi:hypothetical protein